MTHIDDAGIDTAVASRALTAAEAEALGDARMFMERGGFTTTRLSASLAMELLAASAVAVVVIGLILALLRPVHPVSPTPTGALTLSGALSAALPAGSQDSSAGCRVITQTPPPPATNKTVLLTGEVDFGSGASAVVLRFSGVDGMTKLPLPGESIPGFVEIISGGTADWYAGPSSPASSGFLTLSGSTGGTIHGSVDATLAPMRGSTAPLHVAGSWHC